MRPKSDKKQTKEDVKSYDLLSKVSDIASLKVSDFPVVKSGLHHDITKTSLSQIKEYYATIKKAPTMLELLVVGSIWSGYQFEDMAISQIELESTNPHIRKALDLYRTCRSVKPSKAPTTLKDISKAGLEMLATLRADIYRTVGLDNYFAFDIGNKQEQGKAWLSISSSLIKQERGQTAIRKIADECRLKRGTPLMFSRVEVAKNDDKIEERSRFFAEYGSKEGVPSYNDTGIYSHHFNENYELAVSINIHKKLHNNAVNVGDIVVIIKNTNASICVINSDAFESISDYLVNYVECESNLIESCLEFNRGIAINLNRKNGYTLNDVIDIEEGAVLAAIRKNNINKFKQAIEEIEFTYDEIGVAEAHSSIRLIDNGKTILDCKLNMLLNRKNIYTTAVIADRDYAVDIDCDMPADITEYMLSNIRKAKIAGNLVMDGTNGASIFAPLGGKMLLTPTSVNGVIAPMADDKNRAVVYAVGNTSTKRQYPFLSVINSIVLAISKLVASGVPIGSIATCVNGLSSKVMETYSLGDLLECKLGELYCLSKLAIANLGGSNITCSGNETFQHTSTTAVGMAVASGLISNVFKPNQKIYLLKIKRDEYGVPDFKYLLRLYNLVNICITTENIDAAVVIKGNILDTLTASLLGSGAGFSFAKIDESTFQKKVGDIIISAKDITEFASVEYEYLGVVDDTGDIKGAGVAISNKSVLEALFGSNSNANDAIGILPHIESEMYVKPQISTVKPRVVVPYINPTSDIFAKNFEQAGANVIVARAENVQDEIDRARQFRKYIESAEIIALYAPSIIGSGVPHGSTIAKLLDHPIVYDALNELIYRRDGLILGLGEGMRTLIELGLIPTLKKNTNELKMVANDPSGFASNTCRIKVISNKGPWFSGVSLGTVYSVGVGMNEGRIVGKTDYIKNLIWQGQVPTVFVDNNAEPTMQYPFNPTGSAYAIESVMSTDGRVLGRLSYGDRLVTRVNGEESFDDKLLERGVKYFK